MMTLQQHMTRAGKFAGDILAGSGTIPFTVVAETKAGKIIPIVCDTPQSYEDLETLKEGLRSLLSNIGAVSYVVIMQALTIESPEAIARFKNAPTLAGNPDAREIVFIYGENVDGESAMTRRYLLKPEHGKLMLSPAKDYPDVSECCAPGLPTGLLVPAKAKQH